MFEVRGGAAANTATAREALRLFLWAVLFGAIVMLAACGGSDYTPPPPTAPTEASATIGAAGGTLDGPDGMRVVIPPNALAQNTVIRIARSAAGAPANYPEEYATPAAVYEITPHDIGFREPVTISMPAAAGIADGEVFTASAGDSSWSRVTSMTAGGRVQWNVLSFSWWIGPFACAPRANDPYPCVTASVTASASATPATALVDLSAGTFDFMQGLRQYRLTQATSINLRSQYGAARDCGDARITVIRSRPGVTDASGRLIIQTVVNNQLVQLTPQAQSTTRSGGEFNLPVAFAETDNGVHNFRVKFSCVRAFGQQVRSTDYHWIRVSSEIVPVPPVAPAITQQPVNQSVIAPAAATFTAAASGTPAPTAQWQVSTDSGATWSDINGATAASYTTPATVVGDNGKQFRAVFTNSAASAFSAAATLTVAPTPATPLFSTQPANQTVTAGASATFTVAVTGTPAPSLQWQVSADGGVNWADIAGATGTSYTTPATVVGDSGKRYRANATNTAGSATSNAAVLTVNPASVIPIAGALSAIGGHTCALKADQSVACWGLNSSYQLGDGTPMQKNVPAAVSGLSGIVAVSAGAEHSCALKADGSVVCWGSNQFGQIGDGSGLTAPTPVPVPGLSGVVAVSVGDRHSCALKADGSVVCWGKNDRGQLGDGTNVDKATPVAVSGLTDIATISAGWERTCAVGTNGRVECWGRNDSGQLGDGTRIDKPMPTLIAGLLGVVAVRSGGNYHTCALKSDRSVACWGDNGSGSLGSGGPSAIYTAPVAVSGLTDAVALTTGSGHSCAVRSDTSVTCWGENSRGSIGDGSTTNRPTPVAVAGLTGVATVAAGGAYTCALKTDGSASCWGRNITGSLGDGTTVDKPTPTAVVGGAVFWK